MIISSCIRALGDAFEAPKVELAGERHELGLLEEMRQDFRNEEFGLLDNEGTAMRHP